MELWRRGWIWGKVRREWGKEKRTRSEWGLGRGGGWCEGGGYSSSFIDSLINGFCITVTRTVY